MKYYITQTIVEVVDGRLTGREVVLTRADAKVDKDGARLQNVRMFMHKLKALGIENLHVNAYDKKRYNRLIREQNKRRKTKALTIADVAEMTKQFDAEVADNVQGRRVNKKKTYIGILERLLYSRR